MKIGIDVSGFTDLIGAQDFIKSIVIALSCNANQNGYELFIITQKDKQFYKQYKGLKKLFYKCIYLILCKIQPFKLMSKKGTFLDIENLTILEINGNYKKIIQKFQLDCILPITTLSDMNPVPCIRYLYDCQHKYYPQFFSQKTLNERDTYFSAMVKEYCIVNSEDVKKDLVKFYNADENKIFSLPFTPKLKEEYILIDKPEIIKKYNLPKHYFLMSCQFWLHKDHATLFKAFAKFVKTPEFSDVGLVCTGTMEEPRNLEYINELKNLIQTLGIRDKVYLTGCVQKEEQLEIMKNSIGVINTTLFEGGPGGGSIWDACALGIRSIISDISVNLEIRDDLVSFFKTGDSDDLCEKMKKIYLSPKPIFTKEFLVNKTQDNITLLGNVLYDIIKIVIEKSGGDSNNE